MRQRRRAPWEATAGADDVRGSSGDKFDRGSRRVCRNIPTGIKDYALSGGGIDFTLMSEHSHFYASDGQAVQERHLRGEGTTCGSFS